MTKKIYFVCTATKSIFPYNAKEHQKFLALFFNLIYFCK